MRSVLNYDGRLVAALLAAFTLLATVLVAPEPGDAAQAPTGHLTVCADGNYRAYASIAKIGGDPVDVGGTAVATPRVARCKTLPLPDASRWSETWTIYAWGIYLSGKKNFLVGNANSSSGAFTFIPSHGDVTIFFNGSTSGAGLGATALVVQRTSVTPLSNDKPQH